MKIVRAFLYIVFTYTIFDVYAARGQEMFLQGNKYFDEGVTQEALKSYQKIDNKGPVVWYNIAVCYVLQEEYLSALVAMRRAQKDASCSLLKTIDPLLEHVQKKLNLPFDSFFKYLLIKIPIYFSFFWIQILCLIVLLGAVFFTFFSCKNRRLIQSVLIIVCISLLSLLCCLRWINGCTYGIILRESPLYIGPHEQFHTNGTVAVADQVVLKAQEGSWCKIKAKDGVGWIPDSRLSLIE